MGNSHDFIIDLVIKGILWEIRLINPKITVSNVYGTELSVIVSWEAEISEWIEIFKCILAWLKFDPETIDELLGQKEEKV